MNEDLIPRSAAKDKILSLAVIINKPHLLSKEDTLYVLDTLPAVDAEKVCEQMGLVKEAFEMANDDLVAVCRCKDCEAWQTKTAMSFLRDGVPVRCCSCGVYGRLMYEDDFCSKGKRRADA